MAPMPSAGARKIPQERRSNPGMSSDDQELQVSYYIPSVELKGSRAERLARLDTLIRYLEELRRQLAGDAAPRATYEGPSRYVDRPFWPWFLAGAIAGALFLLLAIAARSCAAGA